MPPILTLPSMSKLGSRLPATKHCGVGDAVADGVGVAVSEFVGVVSGVNVGVKVGVAVFVGVLVFVGVIVAVFVGVFVCVLVGVGVSAAWRSNAPMSAAFPPAAFGTLGSSYGLVAPLWSVVNGLLPLSIAGLPGSRA